MEQTDFHMKFRETVSLSLLVAALNTNFPHFHGGSELTVVDDGGKLTREEIFRRIQEFSTNFPQTAVEDEVHIL